MIHGSEKSTASEAAEVTSASRRGFCVALLAGGLGYTAVRSRAADLVEPDSPHKATKAQVHYQDHPKDIRSCGTCIHFKKPNGCTVMQGEVTKDGWCDLFVLID